MGSSHKIKIIKEENLNLNDVNFYSTKDWRDYVYIEIPNFHNIYMDCYFQCEKYFDKQLVLDFFDMPEHVKKNLYDKYGYLINKNVVSISVRRGDYVDMPNLFVPGNVEFINKAMKMFPEGQKYLVSSDDIEWCKNNIKGDNIYYVDKDKNILEDLFICTLCKGNIISNSTFSWWGAYLNKNENRKVIVQSPWFGHDNDIWLRGSKNIVPDDWIKIEQR